MNPIIEINKKRQFQLEEVETLIPVILRITEAANQRVKYLLQRLENLSESDSPNARALEFQADAVVRQWQQKVEKLGAVAKGLWLVDFDNGEGYFCWKFPERKIMYSHGYHDGFTGRKSIHHCRERIRQDALGEEKL